MKKFISILLTFSFIISALGVSAFATEKKDSIDDFINGTIKLVEKYDSKKDFVPEGNNVEVEEEIAMFSEATVDETEDSTKFQTCRLIVQADYDFDTYNAIDVVSGFQNFHILQFENEEDTQVAYENYVNNSNIISVDIDNIYNAFNNSFNGRNDPIYTQTELYDCWSLYATGMDIVKEHFKNEKLPEIVVGVLDTGIDLDHEFFENRLVRTYFNSSGEDNPDDESDVYGHGTKVASVIVKETPENIKIAMYRMGTANGSCTTLSSVTAILQAINDGIKIINMSYKTFDDSQLEIETINFAHENNVFITTSAGNSAANLKQYNVTETILSERTCVVAANNARKTPYGFTDYGEPVDLVAPGEEVRIAVNGGTYSSGTGTSYASPLVAGIYAMMCCVYPTMPAEKKMRLLTGTASPLTEPYAEHSFECGIVNAVEIFNLVDMEAPKFSLEEGTYIGEVSVEITAEDGCDIYYTLDQTYPSPTNGILYTQPINFISDYCELTAVAYKDGKRSNFTSKRYGSAQTGTDDLFTITDDGIITSYTGDINFLKIPETINGITVQNIAEGVFAETDLFGLILPDTMTSIGNAELWGGYNGESFIKGNQNIYFISGKNIKILGQYAFQDCLNLAVVDLPICETIGNYAFMSSGIPGCRFENVKTLSSNAFYCANYIREIYLPNCTEMLDNTFMGCGQLCYIYAPKLDMARYSVEYPDSVLDPEFEGIDQTFKITTKLLHIDLPSLRVIGFYKGNTSTQTFHSSSINRLEFSKLEYLYEVPNPDENNYSPIYLPLTVEMSLPATLKYGVSVQPFLDSETHSLCVYGTKGTYAEQWATDNAIPFYEITQETAIVENIESFWDEYSYKPLEFDARGFNRTYQWYGSTDDIIGNDKIISGANDKTFNPDNYKAYPYYYCMMTSTDGDSVVNIHSSLCQNRLYYIYDTDGTSIDFDNLVIYTTRTCKQTVEDIVGIPYTTTFYYRPSYIYKTHWFYGTGSQFELYNDDDTIDYYTIIVQGDVNGDSAVDVLDAADVLNASNGKSELTGNYLTAADTDFDGEISVYDYSQVVNLALA